MQPYDNAFLGDDVPNVTSGTGVSPVNHAQDARATSNY
jgi:hypothetical protein